MRWLLFRLLGVRVIQGVEGLRVTVPRWWPEAFRDKFLDSARAKLIEGKGGEMIDTRIYNRTMVVTYREGAGR